MSWFSTLNLESLNKLFLHRIKCLYDVETRLIDALPKMSAAATDPELKDAFDEHLQETREQRMRLERVFQRLGVEAERSTDHGLKGIVSGGDEIIAASGDAAVRDAGLIAVGQAVEHYEMALYGTVRTWARYLGLHDLAELLQRSLDEEGSVDKKLTVLAESGVNAQANR